MAEGEHLGAELRIGAGADEHEVSNEADELVGEAEKHADGSCPIARQSAGETAGSRQEALRPASAWGANRTDGARVTAHLASEHVAHRAVGALPAQLQSLALDPPIPPSGSPGPSERSAPDARLSAPGRPRGGRRL